MPCLVLRGRRWLSQPEVEDAAEDLGDDEDEDEDEDKQDDAGSDLDDFLVDEGEEEESGSLVRLSQISYGTNLVRLSQIGSW